MKQIKLVEKLLETVIKEINKIVCTCTCTRPCNLTSFKKCSIFSSVEQKMNRVKLKQGLLPVGKFRDELIYVPWRCISTANWQEVKKSNF